MSDKIRSLQDKREEKEIESTVYINAAAMCLLCQHRWIAFVPITASLFKLECPVCRTQNSFASVLPLEYLDAIAQSTPPDKEPEVPA